MMKDKRCDRMRINFAESDFCDDLDTIDAVVLSGDTSISVDAALTTEADLLATSNDGGDSGALLSVAAGGEGNIFERCRMAT
jgi:hypothetical protein